MTATRNDKLIVKGHGRADGEYDVDLKALLNIGTPGSLNILEQHQVFTVSGVRPRGLPEAFLELDAMVMVALAQVILGRNEKTVRVETLVQGRLVYSDGSEADPAAGVKQGLIYVVDNADVEDDDEGDALPPQVRATDEPSTNGGESTRPSLVPQENDQSPTGHPDSPRSATSGQEISAA